MSDRTENRPNATKPLLDEHLLFDHARMVSMGVYYRAAEFRTKCCKLNKAQKERLEIALNSALSNSSCASFSAMSNRLIEHELILARAPTEEDVLENIRSISITALSCLTLLHQLQKLFNLADHTLAPPSYDFIDAKQGGKHPPDAKTIAVDLIKLSVEYPIPATLNLGPLIESCDDIRDRFIRRRSGPKSPLYLYLFLLCLFNIAKANGVKPTLPSKAAVAKDGSGKTSRFFDFAREALNIVDEIAQSALDQATVGMLHRKIALRKIADYRKLSDSQLRLRLSDVRAGKIVGLNDFIKQATT